MDIALIAIVIAAAIATVLAVRTLRRSAGISNHRSEREPDAADPQYRQVAHYRASGVLPRWDP